MAFVLWLSMSLVPLLLGRGALRLLYGNRAKQDISLADDVLTGGIIMIGLAEAAHLAGCLLGRSFSDCVKVFGAGLAFLLAAAAVICFLEKKKHKKNAVWQRRAERDRLRRSFIGENAGAVQYVYLLFGIVTVVQLILVVMTRNVYLDGDMTRETVSSFLASDAVYQVNPMTGQPYAGGMPLRLEVLCLPTLYGILCKSFGLSVDTVVLSTIPSFVLLGSYLAYSTVAKRLFPVNRTGRAVFLLAVALLYSFGDYMPAMDGFGVLHSGFRGTAIRSAVLLPYIFGLMLRKKYKLAVLCILAEACIVWTLYGMGACMAVAAGMLVVRIVLERCAAHRGRKEADVC